MTRGLKCAVSMDELKASPLAWRSCTIRFVWRHIFDVAPLFIDDGDAPLTNLMPRLLTPGCARRVATCESFGGRRKKQAGT